MELADPAPSAADWLADAAELIFDEARSHRSRLQRAWAAIALADSLGAGAWARTTLLELWSRVPGTPAAWRIAPASMPGALHAVLTPVQWGRLVRALLTYLHSGTPSFPALSACACAPSADGEFFGGRNVAGPAQQSGSHAGIAAPTTTSRRSSTATRAARWWTRSGGRSRFRTRPCASVRHPRRGKRRRGEGRGNRWIGHL